MLPLFIARRHLVSRKSHSVINLISAVSIVAIAIPVAAMVIILSFHNGLSDFIEKLYSEFDSELRVTAREGQTFTPAPDLMRRIGALEQTEAVSATLEQQVLLTYSDRQWIAIMRGVDENYGDVVPLANRMVQGRYQLRHGDLDRAVVGQGAAYSLGISPSLLEPLRVYAIRPGSGNTSFLPTSLYNSSRIHVSGIYALDEQTDSRYVFVPLDFARELLQSGERISSLEIRLKEGADIAAGQQAVQQIAGDHLRVQTRYQQKETIYKMVSQEKWIIYLLLLFVILIAALSLVGSVVMLATDKKQDLATLRSVGASRGLLRKIFTTEGMLITLTGIASGLLLGVGFSLLQQHYGLIGLSGEAFLMQSYPVRVQLSDLMLTATGVLLAGGLISYLTTCGLIKKQS